MNSVAVIVLNWNGIKDTLLCIDSLLQQSKKDFTIILVDNGSTDSSKAEFQKLEKKYKDTGRIHVLYNAQNLGFTGGVNTGLNWGIENNFKSIALLNNDAIASPYWLHELDIKLNEQEKIGAVTGLLLNTAGEKIDSTGEQYSYWGLPFPRDRGKQANEAPSEQFVFGTTGGATLYRVSMLKEIGLFDSPLFAYYEDTDISFRGQLAGWKFYYTPKAIAYHKQGATTNRMPSGFAVLQTFKNLPVIFLKNVPRELILTIGLRFWLAYILMLGNAIKNGNGKVALLGWCKSLTLIGHALRARRRIQKSKKVPTSYIKSMLWLDLPPDQTGIRKLRKFFTGKP